MIDKTTMALKSEARVALLNNVWGRIFCISNHLRLKRFTKLEYKYFQSSQLNYYIMRKIAQTFMSSWDFYVVFDMQK